MFKMFQMPKRVSFASGALALLVLSACGGDRSATSANGPDPSSAAAIPAEVFVPSAPGGAIGVQEAIRSAEAGAEIVVRAVVGGREKVFVDERAILVAIDTGLQSCTGDEGCTTPWDYCCETRETLLANTMTVQVVDADGTPLAASLKGVHGLRALATVVVAGTVRSNEGSLILDAKRIHVVDD